MLDNQQFEQFVADFKQAFASDDFENWLKKFLLREAYRVLTQAVKRTPVDTGALRASWYVGDEVKRIFTNKETGKLDSDYGSAFAQRATVDSVKVKGNDLLVVIGNSASYADFVEYGTVKQRGRFMISIPIRQVSQAMPSRFNNEFAKYIRSKKL